MTFEVDMSNVWFASFSQVFKMIPLHIKETSKMTFWSLPHEKPKVQIR